VFIHGPGAKFSGPLQWGGFARNKQCLCPLHVLKTFPKALSLVLIFDWEFLDFQSSAPFFPAVRSNTFVVILKLGLVTVLGSLIRLDLPNYTHKLQVHATRAGHDQPDKSWESKPWYYSGGSLPR
jgi:hypothetical protein